MVADIHDGF
jgi:hypothetical protein